MVKLLSTSPVELRSPALTEWDNSVRENFAMYQREIDKTTYALQRSLRGFWIFGQSFYPALTQHYGIRLQLYKQKQSLGKIHQSEVNQYKVVNPDIAYHLNNTFSTNWLWPNLQDLAIIGGLQAYAQIFNFAYSWRIGFLAIPYCARIFYQYATSYESKHQTSEFLSWVTQVRKAKAQAERHSSNLSPELVNNYKAVLGTAGKGPLQLYEEVISLAQGQLPNL